MLGYRFWDFADTESGPTLRSAVAPYDWQGNVVGENIDYLAKVIPDQGLYFVEESKIWERFFPEEDTEEIVVPELGFFAYNKLTTAIHEADMFGTPLVIGAVNGFGKVAVHSSGWRAEYCQVLGFLDFIPCSEHPAMRGNILLRHDYNMSLCNQHADIIKKMEKKPKVQYAHDFFLKELCRRYDVDTHSFRELLKIGDK